jgi:hypothetical protein
MPDMLNDPMKTYTFDFERIETHRREIKNRAAYVEYALEGVQRVLWNGKGSEEESKYYAHCRMTELQVWLDVVKQELMNSFPHPEKENKTT